MTKKLSLSLQLKSNHITMALLTDINDLLNKRKVESNRIEFKKGWNPTAIYRSICAFANDIFQQHV